MTPNQLQQIIAYAKETEEALYEFDMDALAMQTELPILHQTIEQLMKASADCKDGNFRVLITAVEKKVTVFIKKINKSVFRDGTGIPIHIRKFFGIEDMLAGEQRKATLNYKEASFNTTIVMDKQPSPRTQLRWNSDLANLLQDGTHKQERLNNEDIRNNISYN